ncbi:MAG: PAS domain S-box protein [Candidatus Margulisiibacteriota bacterium]
MMQNIFASQLDYIYFFYGLAFLFFSMVCFGIGKKFYPNFYWLGLFGLLHGFNEWLDMVALLTFDSPIFYVIRLMILAQSFIFLFEFGRRVFAKRLSALIYCLVIPLALFGAFFGLAETNITIRCFLGVSGSILAALGLFSLASVENKSAIKYYLALSGTLFIFYGVSFGMFVAGSQFFVLFPSNLWGIPIQLVRSLLAVSITIALWKAIRSRDKVEYHAKLKGKLLSDRMIVLVILTIIFLGWGLTNFLEEEFFRNIVEYPRLVGIIISLISSFSAIWFMYFWNRREEDVYTMNLEKEKFLTTLRSIGDGVIVVNSNFEIVLLNEISQQLTGWRETDAIGKNIKDVFIIINGSNRQPQINPIVEALRSNKIVNLANHAILIAKDKSEKIIADSAAPIHNAFGDVYGAVLVFRDVSAISRANDEIKTKYEELNRLRLAMLNVNEDLQANLLELQKSQETNRQLAEIVESSDDAIVGKRLDGTIFSWNKGAELLYGYTREEMLGKSVLILMPQDNKAEFREIMEKIGRGEHVIHHETKRITKDGRMLDISITISPIFHVAGKIIGASAIARDITEQKRIAGDLAYKTALLSAQTESTLDGILVVSTEGKTLFANQRFVKMWNIAPEIMEQKDDPKMIASVLSQLANPNQFVEKVQYLYSHVTEKSIDEIAFKDGKVFDRYSSPLTKIDGNDIGRIWYFRDITEKKQYENEIKSKNAELEKLYQIKNDFTSIVSHELRTPLTSIKEGIAIVLDQTAGPINAEQKEFLAIAKRNVDRLHHLINDVLALQKLEAGKLQFNMQLGDILAVTKEAVEGQKLAAKEKGLAIKLEQSGDISSIYFDVDQIMLVLNNYLSNAIKFTNQGNITVKVMPDSWNGGVKVGVFDSGIGISAEDISKLFQRYQQLGGLTDRKTGGTGLGLALSKEIIEKHNGKVWVESELGKGSAFWFTLPGKK